MSSVQVGDQVVTVSDYGEVEGIAAVNPKIAIAIALRAYPAGRGQKVEVHYISDGRWSIRFIPR